MEPLRELLQHLIRYGPARNEAEAERLEALAAAHCEQSAEPEAAAAAPPAAPAAPAARDRFTEGTLQ
ncbi:MAG: hypothetical protein ACLP5E_22710 [Streptosporangiaceae bacterium]